MARPYAIVAADGAARRKRRRGRAGAVLAVGMGVLFVVVLLCPFDVVIGNHEYFASPGFGDCRTAFGWTPEQGFSSTDAGAPDSWRVKARALRLGPFAYLAGEFDYTSELIPQPPRPGLRVGLSASKFR